jgi:hypothetical protein
LVGVFREPAMRHVNGKFTIFATIVAALAPMPLALAQSGYLVTVNTSSVNGQQGTIDLQFNAGVLTSENACATISSFTTDGTLGSPPVITGSVTGTLATSVTINNGSNGCSTPAVSYTSWTLNDYTQPITFGNQITFLVAFNGPGVTNPNSTVYSSGSSFAVAFAIAASDHSPPFTPALSGDPNNLAGIINLNLDGTLTPVPIAGPGKTASLVTIQIPATPQTITVTTHAQATAAYNSTFNVSAAASSGLPVAITATGACSVSTGGSSSATILMTSGTGTCTVNYDQAGNATYSAAQEVTETTTLQGANPGLPGSTNTGSTYGQSVILSVTVSPVNGGQTPTGTVTFDYVKNSQTYYVCADGSLSTTACSVPLVNGAATVTTTNLPPGTDSVVATYNGDSDYASGGMTTVSVSVVQASTSVSLSKKPANTTTYGSPAELDLQVTDSTPNSSKTPTGTITLSYVQNGTTYHICSDGSISASVCSGSQVVNLTSGAAIVTNIQQLPAGSYGITASYSGDPDFAANSISGTQTVSPLALGAVTGITAFPRPYNGTTAATLNTSGAALNGVLFSDNVTLNASGASGLFSDPNVGANKTVTISGLTLLGTAASNYSLTTPQATATASITIVQPAFSGLSASQVINQGAASITLSGTISASCGGACTVYPPAGETVSANVGGAAGTGAIGSSGSFSFSVSTGALPASATPYTISYTYSGDTNFKNASDNSTSLAIHRSPAITSASAATFRVGVAGSFTVTATGYPAPTFSETGALPTGVTLNPTTGALSGTPAAGTGGVYNITITASNGVLPNATQAFVLSVQDFAISAAPPAQTISSGHAAVYTVTLKSLGGLTGNVSLKCSGGPPNSTCTISPTSVSLAGSSKATITLSTSMNVNHGTFSLQFTGTLLNLTHTATVSLTVK